MAKTETKKRQTVEDNKTGLKVQRMRVRLTFTEEVLGTASNNPNIHDDYIASKAPDAPSREEEVAALGTGEAAERTMTVFPQLKDGTPFVWDYQIKGFFKDAIGMLRRVKGTKASKLTAYKKEVDGLVFVQPRQIEFENVIDILEDACEGLLQQVCKP